MNLGKKENLKTSLRILGILYLKAWLLRVQVSLFGTRNFYVLISTRLLDWDNFGKKPLIKLLSANSRKSW